MPREHHALRTIVRDVWTVAGTGVIVAGMVALLYGVATWVSSSAAWLIELLR